MKMQVSKDGKNWERESAHTERAALILRDLGRSASDLPKVGMVRSKKYDIYVRHQEAGDG